MSVMTVKCFHSQIGKLAETLPFKFPLALHYMGNALRSKDAKGASGDMPGHRPALTLRHPRSLPSC